MSKRNHRYRHDPFIDSAYSSTDDVWPVFSDISMALVLFFVFMLVAQFLELSQVFDELTRKQQQELFWRQFRENSIFQEAIEKGAITEERKGSLQRLRFSADIVFVKGEANLQPRGREVLTHLAQFLTEYGHPKLLIEVEGHTDRLPIHSGRYEDNWELSSERALAVVRLFHQLSQEDNTNVKLEMNRISAIGYGEYQPLEDKIESKINRRIEIRLDYSQITAKNS